MNVKTPEFRVSYPNVFKARKNDLNGKDEYSVVALFPKDADMSALKAACEAACEKKWGTEKAKWPANLRSPFRDQADRAKKDEQTGKMVLPAGYESGAKYLNLKSERMPGLVDKKVQPITDQGEFYAGCYAVASLQAYAYDQKGNRGVSFGLQNIMKTKEGEPFGNRVKAEDDFAPLAGTQAAGASGEGDAASIFD